LLHPDVIVLAGWIDDPDRERPTAEFDQAIGEDPAWMGPEPLVRQSERFDAGA
jgi:glutamyl/glutaminyl-tRNA synthetase